MGELARLNQHLRHEVGERERSEAESRKAFARLEETFRSCGARSRSACVTEEMLRGSERKMEALGQLTGGIAHDFNNLLRVIIGSRRARCATRSTTRDKVADVVQRDRGRPRDRAASLTRQLLAFARSQMLRAAGAST